ncbi:hypothetical protein CDA63_19755 [Hymenobacter amundsenii]|uniref:HEAT repeat domain-containing protein n=1 Tax=Hymenobacter amundsenii TaxID=2006685 RepID=A0A246FFU5_9BACT|nr:hypothetical protein [Hymenobacter amundsenii]OWP61376.1 hypothetical protein CDA63_19755 [Hymenobacter amundsenii]
MTIEETIQHLAIGSIEQKLAVLRGFTQEMAVPELYPLLLNNLTHSDDRVVFLSMDALVKKYPDRIRQDAALLTPQLLAFLTSGDGPITDRAMWALSLTGPDSVYTLLDFITQSLDDYQLEMGIWALGRNGHIRRASALVVNTLRKHLQHSNPRVNYAALCSLMDMSPLRPFGHLQGVEQEFELLYPELQATAQFLLDTAPELSGMPEQYLELLRNRPESGASF